MINIDAIKINGFGRREDILLSSIQTNFACVCNVFLSDNCIYKLLSLFQHVDRNKIQTQTRKIGTGGEGEQTKTVENGQKDRIKYET